MLTKLSDVVKLLNTAVKKVSFKGIHTHREFHDLIEKVCKETLPEGFTVGIWKISYKSEYQVINYDRNFKQYEHCINAVRGNFSNVKFFIELTVPKANGYEDSKYSTDLKISEVEDWYKKQRYEVALQRAEQRLKNAQMELIESELAFKRLKARPV